MNLQEITRRARGASEAEPWLSPETHYDDFTPEMREKISPGGPWHREAAVRRASDRTVLALTGPIDDEQSLRDAEFYSHAKGDILKLAAHVERLQSLLDATADDEIRPVQDTENP